MKFLFILVVAVIFFIVTSDQIQGDKHLIAFNETTRVWMTQKEIDELLANKHNLDSKFMDITYTPNLEYGRVAPVSQIPSKLTQQLLVNELNKQVSEEKLRNGIQTFSSFYDRAYNTDNGTKAALWLRDQYQGIINALPEERKTLFSIHLFQHTWKQPSIIVKIKGSSQNATIAKEVVILGAHEDSLNYRQRTRPAPGADDNASGSITILEAFRIIAQSKFKPARTLEFHGYAAEEAGLLGSQAIAQQYKNSNIPVLGQLNLDMTGYNANNRNTIGVISDYTNAELTAFVRLLVKEYSGYPQGNYYCGYGCSDHASWNRAGYRSSNIFETDIASGMNRNIHTENDTIEKLDLKRGLAFVKTSVGFAVELSAAQ